MNTRIQELASQAGWGPTSDPYVRQAFNVKMFAELIIQECVRIGQETSKEIFKMSKKQGDIFEYESHGAEQVVDNIKEHFGVE